MIEHLCAMLATVIAVCIGLVIARVLLWVIEAAERMASLHRIWRRI